MFSDACITAMKNNLSAFTLDTVQSTGLPYDRTEFWKRLNGTHAFERGRKILRDGSWFYSADTFDTANPYPNISLIIKNAEMSYLNPYNDSVMYESWFGERLIWDAQSDSGAGAVYAGPNIDMDPHGTLQTAPERA